MSELENALAQHAPPIKVEDPTRHEMPPLVILFSRKNIFGIKKKLIWYGIYKKTREINLFFPK